MKKPQIKFVLVYVSVGIFWIATTADFFFGIKNLTPPRLSTIQTAKDILLIGLSSFFIYWMLQRWYDRFRRLKEEYTQLFSGNPYPMWIYDLETLSFLKVNKAAVTNYGYSEKEFLNMTIKDIRPQEEIEKLMYRMKGLTDDMSLAGIWQHRRKDGEILLAKISTNNISFHGRKCRFVVAQDVTNKQAMEEQLKKSNSELNILINSITDGFVIIDKNLIIQRSNAPLREMAGIFTDTLTGKSLPEVFPGLSNQFSQSQFTRAFDTNEAIHFESFYEQKGIWLRTTAYPFKNELSVILRNITKEKEDELRILKNQQDVYALINNTTDLIWSIDRNFRFYTYNKPYRDEYTRYVGEKLWIGKHVFPANISVEAANIWKPLYEKALSGKSFSTEMEIHVPDIGKRYAFIRFNPIFDKTNYPIGVGCFLHDVTLSKGYSERIREKNKHLREITYTISHDLKKPLEELLEITQLLTNDLPGNTTIQVVEKISTSAKRLDEIIKHMVMQTAQVSDD